MSKPHRAQHSRFSMAWISPTSTAMGMTISSSSTCSVANTKKRKTQTVGVTPLYSVGQIDNRPQYKRNTLPESWRRHLCRIAQLADSTPQNVVMPLFLDVDLDGYEDVLVSTGHTRDSLNADAVEAIMRGRRGRKLSDRSIAS